MEIEKQQKKVHESAWKIEGRQQINWVSKRKGQESTLTSVVFMQKLKANVTKYGFYQESEKTFSIRFGLLRSRLCCWGFREKLCDLSKKLNRPR